ncbi:unnamed protein product [Moneuplotes crassus]|uniref:Uncharacterized protein n=1 Tax=Euplotes crassus TaxID=5936 RepID=A0AAD1Y8E3_EUPCR|nr:unnamed protein product [Moneuplotes crassus]|eukprot:CAMPEP_0197006010 /NCGR_PEP_ID=MMETSP1380-20130617/32583_1 /TAXON_ID=5936 /ORGANISM="Euplotes crassus, Strain CT5" /LENGTH=104 /DNA_ID=CAMNT_0042425399 /DNA_START=3 /DNA_END=317 /DNA_ORIENTATION=+
MAEVENEQPPIEAEGEGAPEDQEPAAEPVLDESGGYDDPEEGERAEKIALCSQHRINPNALPNQDYLEMKVMPTVLKGLAEVCEVRPENPVEFFAYYLLKHSPE